MTTPRPVRIMIVEDDRAIGDVLRNVVDELPGWEATVVGDGRDALHALHAQPMDMLLIDVNLPDTTGPQLLERMRLQPGMATTPAIFMSAAGLNAAVQTALRQGQATAFVAKPFDLDDIVDLLESTVAPAAPVAQMPSPARVTPPAPETTIKRWRGDPRHRPVTGASMRAA